MPKDLKKMKFLTSKKIKSNTHEKIKEKKKIEIKFGRFFLRFFNRNQNIFEMKWNEKKKYFKGKKNINLM